MNIVKPKPFLKWAGGKSGLLRHLQPLVPKQYNRYYEPFVGGGALLFSICPQQALINDSNAQLVNAYKQIKNNVDSVVSLIGELESKQPCLERYIELRSLYNDYILSDTLNEECSALLLWLNKYSFNGLYRVNRRGEFNVPYNNNTRNHLIDTDNLRAVSLYLNRSDIRIVTGDFEEACVDVVEDDFVYFDSPYVPITKTSNFTDYTKSGFCYGDHVRTGTLFKKLTSIGAKCMLSNNDVPLVNDLYKDYTIKHITVHRAINANPSKRRGTEVIITNY